MKQLKLSPEVAQRLTDMPACKELRDCDLHGVALFIAYSPHDVHVLRAAATMAELASAATIRRRNRKPGERFLERACLGALAGAQAEAASNIRKAIVA